jgi:hypothetical protein
MDEVKARVFALYVELARISGEPVAPLPPDPSTANRLALYARLAALWQRRVATPSNAAERAADKTLASTIAALSVEAWHANYPTIVLALLRQQADVIANLDVKVRAVQNAVLAQAAYTPAQIDALIAQINVLLNAPDTGDTSVLYLIKAELVRMGASAQATGTAVNELRNSLFTDADLNVELYQALVLEYHQYVPSSKLAQAIGIEARQAIAARVSGREVLINDTSADGNGRVLRANFGLPDPLP